MTVLTINDDSLAQFQYNDVSYGKKNTDIEADLGYDLCCAEGGKP